MNKSMYLYIKDLKSESDTKFKSISLEQIERIASIAVDLKPENMLPNNLAYLSVLSKFFINEKNKYMSIYRDLCNNNLTYQYLINVIELRLMEQKFRDSGISVEDVEKYNRIVIENKNIIERNNEFYNKEMKKEKSEDLIESLVR